MLKRTLKVIDNVFSDPVAFLLGIVLFYIVGLFIVNLLELFGFQPCALCKLERYLVMTIIFFGVLGLTISRFFRYPKAIWFSCFAVIFMVFTVSAVTAYHFGVEYGVFEVPAFCQPKSLDVVDVDSLTTALLSGNTTAPCEQKQDVFGISIVTFALVSSLSAFVACIAFVTKQYRIRKIK